MLHGDYPTVYKPDTQRGTSSREYPRNDNDSAGIVAQTFLVQLPNLNNFQAEFNFEQLEKSKQQSMLKRPKHPSAKCRHWNPHGLKLWGTVVACCIQLFSFFFAFKQKSPPLHKGKPKANLSNEHLKWTKFENKMHISVSLLLYCGARGLRGREGRKCSPFWPIQFSKTIGSSKQSISTHRLHPIVLAPWPIHKKAENRPRGPKP